MLFSFGRDYRSISGNFHYNRGRFFIPYNLYKMIMQLTVKECDHFDSLIYLPDNMNVLYKGYQIFHSASVIRSWNFSYITKVILHEQDNPYFEFILDKHPKLYC